MLTRHACRTSFLSHFISLVRFYLDWWYEVSLARIFGETPRHHTHHAPITVNIKAHNWINLQLVLHRLSLVFIFLWNHLPKYEITSVSFLVLHVFFHQIPTEHRLYVNILCITCYFQPNMQLLMEMRGYASSVYEKLFLHSVSFIFNCAAFYFFSFHFTFHHHRHRYLHRQHYCRSHHHRGFLLHYHLFRRCRVLLLQIRGCENYWTDVHCHQPWTKTD